MQAGLACLVYAHGRAAQRQLSLMTLSKRGELLYL